MQKQMILFSVNRKPISVTNNQHLLHLALFFFRFVDLHKPLGGCLSLVESPGLDFPLKQFI
jgi:hypothetical protein